MYQAYGKSETLSVSGPDPVARSRRGAERRGRRHAAAASRRIGVCGAVVGVVLAVVGSSLSAGRGGRGRAGPADSDRAARRNLAAAARARAARVPADRGRPRGGAARSEAAWIGACSTRGGVGSPRGEPTAATLGVSTTNTGFGPGVGPHRRPQDDRPRRTPRGQWPTRPRGPAEAAAAPTLDRCGSWREEPRQAPGSQRSRAGSVTMPSRSMPARRTRSIVSTTAPYESPASALRYRVLSVRLANA